MKALLHELHRWIAVVSGTLVCAFAYGSFAALGAKLVLPISEIDALLFVGLPVAVAMAMYIGPKMSKISGFGE